MHEIMQMQELQLMFISNIRMSLTWHGMVVRAETADLLGIGRS